MPDFEPTGEVIHRTDASVVSLPFAEIRDRLASESYYKVEYRQHGSHNLIDVMVFTVKDTWENGNEYYRLYTTTEVYDVSYPHGKEKRKPMQAATRGDVITFDKLSEALTAAKIEAVLHHAHTRRFRNE